MAQRNDLRICVDRVLPDEVHPARAALERAARNRLAEMMAGVDGAGPLQPMKMALMAVKKWDNGVTLRCRFLEGDATQRKKAEQFAHQWEKYANVKFKFVATGPAEIRIAFMTGQGSWSALGTDALVERFFPTTQPTMNFGWLKADTVSDEWERVVVHEFGHALGCIHEHQSPSGGLKWNEAEVYRVFSGAPNFWTREQIKFNILDRYSRTQTQFTKFDGDSIMLYSFPGSLFKDGKGTKNNTRLSATDRAFIAQMYPKPKPKPKVTRRRPLAMSK